MGIDEFDGFYQACRTCLRTLTGDFQFYNMDYVDNALDVNLKKKLLTCVPEMNLDTWSSTICFSCSIALRSAYEFKKMCLKTEEIVQTRFSYQLHEIEPFLFEEKVIKADISESYCGRDTSADVITRQINGCDYDEWPEENYFSNDIFSGVREEEIDVYESGDSWKEESSVVCESNPFSFEDELVVQSKNTETENIYPQSCTPSNSDVDKIVRWSCENVELLKNQNITPKSLQCYVSLEKLTESEETGAKKSYPCSVCFDEFNTKSGLMCHKKIAHGEKSDCMRHKVSRVGGIYSCNYCTNTYTKKKSLVAHQKYHTNRICSDCGKHFGSKRTLRQHTINRHIKKENKLTPQNKPQITVPEDVFEKALKELKTKFFSNDLKKDDSTYTAVSEDTIEETVNEIAKKYNSLSPPVLEKYCSSGSCICPPNSINQECLANRTSQNLTTSFIKLSKQPACSVSAKEKKKKINTVVPVEPIRKSKIIVKEKLKTSSKAIKTLPLKKNCSESVSTLSKPIHELYCEHNYCKPNATNIRQNKCNSKRMRKSINKLKSPQVQKYIDISKSSSSSESSTELEDNGNDFNNSPQFHVVNVNYNKRFNNYDGSLKYVKDRDANIANVIENMPFTYVNKLQRKFVIPKLNNVLENNTNYDKPISRYPKYLNRKSELTRNCAGKSDVTQVAIVDCKTSSKKSKTELQSTEKSNSSGADKEAVSLKPVASATETKKNATLTSQELQELTENVKLPNFAQESVCSKNEICKSRGVREELSTENVLSSKIEMKTVSPIAIYDCKNTAEINVQMTKELEITKSLQQPSDDLISKVSKLPVSDLKSIMENRTVQKSSIKKGSAQNLVSSIPREPICIRIPPFLFPLKYANSHLKSTVQNSTDQ